MYTIAGRGALLAISIALMLPAVAPAQERARDRRQWTDSTTRVSADPRRIPIPATPRGPDGTLVLTGGRVFDATGTAARGASLVIERNRIRAVLPAEATDWPADARVIDVTGHTIMPGLIDLHTHLSYTDGAWPGAPTPIAPVPLVHANDAADGALRGVERLRYYIESGITSVRDVASHDDIAFRLKEWVAENRIPGPRVFAAGRIIVGTGGHGAEGDLLTSSLRDAVRTASGPDDWREAVREQFNAGADVIKIGSHFSRAEIAAAVEEAHALGIRVTVDAETFYVRWAVEAGADNIEHPLPRSDETIRLMAERGTAATPTLVPYIIIFNQNGGYWGSTSRRFTFSKESMREMLVRFRRAGVKTGIGTDLVFSWFRFLPEAYMVELREFVTAGYSVPETLIAATRTSAEILDMDDRLGTLEPGKLADVLVVRGRPDQNLEDLVNVHLVIRDGHIIVENGRVVIPRHESMAFPQPISSR